MMQARIRQASLVAVVVAASVVVFAGTVFAQSSNPLVGTWKLNIAKSKYNAGKAPKSSTTVIEAAGAGVKFTIDSVGVDGTVRHWTYTTNIDGKDSPIVGNATQGDTAAATRVDANTIRTVYKKGGTVTITATSVVSGDGKTRTNTGKGKDALGQNTDSVQVYEKQ